jgi:hypothetical protein
MVPKSSLPCSHEPANPEALCSTLSQAWFFLRWGISPSPIPQNGGRKIRIGFNYKCLLYNERPYQNVVLFMDHYEVAQVIQIRLEAAINTRYHLQGTLYNCLASRLCKIKLSCLGSQISYARPLTTGKLVTRQGPRPVFHIWELCLFTLSTQTNGLLPHSYLHTIHDILSIPFDAI